MLVRKMITICLSFVLMISGCFMNLDIIKAQQTLENLALDQVVYTYPATSDSDKQIIVDGDKRYEYNRNGNKIPFLDVPYEGASTPLDENQYYYKEDAYIIVDLGASYLIDSLKIYDFMNSSSNKRDYSYSVSLSNDESLSIDNQESGEWTYIGRTLDGLDTCITDFNLPDKVVARYVKLHDLRTFGAYSFAMSEIEVYGVNNELSEIKDYAYNQLDHYKNYIEIPENELLQKNGIINDAKSIIDNSEDINEVIDVLNQTYKEIDKVIEFFEYQYNAIDDLNHYKNSNTLFSTKDRLLQLELLKEASEAIHNATTISLINEIVETYKYEIDQFIIIENLALNKDVYASSKEANSVKAELAVDGNTTSRSSRWGSAKGNGPHWIYVDLGEEKEISTVKIYWENRKATSYSIQISHDASSWETVQAFNSRPIQLEDYFTFSRSKTARYVRLYIDSFTSQDPDGGIEYNTISIYEIEVYSARLYDSTNNLARGKEVVASSKEAESVKAELAIDGDTTSRSSRWGSAKGEGPHWIYVDLGEIMDVMSVKVFWENRKATAYCIQVSDDALTWKTVKKFKQRPVHIDERIVFDELQKTRYVRLYIESFTADDPDTNASWNTVSIYEFEVYSYIVKPSLNEYLNKIIIDPIDQDDTKLSYTLPDLEEGITITYNGTDYEQVIDYDGTLYKPLVDTRVLVSFKIENKNNGSYEFIEYPITVPGLYQKEDSDNEAPLVLPELREWKGLSGTFSILESSKMIIEDECLNEMANEFISDYKEITGFDIEVIKGHEDDVKEGDFFFSITDGLSKGLKDEGYMIYIDDAIKVESNSAVGAYWASRTLLQALKTSDHLTINKGITRDYPLYEVRGMILDVGRKTFTLDQLKQIVKQMSWYKMNDFHVHLNDNFIWLKRYINNDKDPFSAYSGFRLESDIKKGDTVILGNENKEFTYSDDLTSKDVYYTKEEFKEFIQTSKVLGVNIVPEIDTPAHSLALTKVLPELRTSASGRDNDHLDLAKQYDESYDFVTNIFDEYLLGEDPVFSSDTVHIGCDEYVVAPNAFRQFCKDMIEYIESTGRIARLWGSLTRIIGDGSVIVEGHGVQMNLWDEGYANMHEMYELGYDLINCNDNDYYIVPNAGYYKDYLNANTMYNLAMNSIGGKTIPAGDKQMIGGAFAIWNDMCDYLNNGISEYDVYDRFNQHLGLFAAKVWGKGDYSLSKAQEVKQLLGDSPNTNFNYEIKDEQDYIIDSVYNSEIVDDNGMKVIELKGSSSYATTLFETVGLNNSLSVKVKRMSDNNEEQILFESPYGTIKAVQKETGKVGISRENFDYSFNYTLPVNEWVDLEFRNQFKVISLYVNGELIDTLGDGETVEGRKMITTCMFPLAKIGSEDKAMSGYVTNIQLNGKELKIANADYTKVNEALDKVPDDLSIYTKESIETLNNAINGVVYDLDISKQDEVDKMAQEILNALNALEEIKIPVQKDLLLDKLEEYKDIQASSYSEESFVIFFNAYKKALEVYQNDNALQSEVNHALNELIKAYEDLEKIVNKDALNKVIEEVENTKADDYTKESYDAFKAALDTAKAVLADEQASQDAVDTVLADLQAAIEGLKEVEKPEKPFPFTDVSDKQWYYGVINEAYQLGLMSGATETLFKPNANMNRGMVAIVFHRMEGSKKVEYSSIFPDVANKQYYTTSVLWAKQTGVINGYTNGTFKPLRNVSREEMATMIYNFARYKGLDMSASKDITYFSDYSQITPYAVGPLQWAVEKGLMSGKLNGTNLDPLGTATRAECSKMLVQAYKVIYK